MIHKSYVCNFCRRVIDQESIIGLYWVNNKRLEKRHPTDTENHLCQECAEAICAVFREAAS